MTSKLANFLAGALVALVASYATAVIDAQPKIMKGTHVNIAPEDYIEILGLQYEYPRDVDPGSVRDATWMFMPGARSIIGGAPMIKAADFKQFYGSLVAADGQASKGGNRHFNTSPIVVGMPDGTARGSSMMMGISVKEPGGRPTIDLMGKYEDVYVKTPDGWRMKERHWKADQHVGSYQKVWSSPVYALPHTWKTEQEEAIQRLLREGYTRDESGTPRPVPQAAPAASPRP